MLTACTHCHHRFVVPPECNGRAARCSICGERFLIETRVADRLALAADDDDLLRDLNLPTLSDIEECVEAPDVAAAEREAKRGPLLVPAIKPPQTLDYLQGQQSVATMLLLMCALVLFVYGLRAAQVPETAAEAEAAGIAVPLKTWTRSWEPLLVGSLVSLLTVGVLFWAGAQVAARMLRMRYQSSGILESFAIASVPLTLPMVAVLVAGSDGPGVVIPAAVAAFPAVCLLVPALFGMPLARGLTTAVICITISLPAFVLTTVWAGNYQRQAVELDDQRIASVIERRREAMAQSDDGAQTVPADAPPAVAPAVQEVVAMARELVEQRNELTGDPPPAHLNIPTLPLATTVTPPRPVEVEAVAPTAPAVPEPSPAAERETEATEVAPAAVAIAEPSIGRGAPRVSAWTEAGAPVQVVWPAVPGAAFATVRLDQFANHVVEFWSCDDLSRRGTLRMGGGSAISYAICPAGETLLRVVDGAVPFAELWTVSDGARRVQLQLAANQQSPRALGFFDANTFGILVRSENESAIDVFDSRRLSLRRRIGWPSNPAPYARMAYTPENIAITPDGKGLMLIDTSGQLRLLDMMTGTPRRSWALNLPRQTNLEVTAISISVDGTNAAVLLDEAQGANQSALFWCSLSRNEVTAISLSDPLWRQAGVARTAGRRVGRVMDWVGREELLAYGEIVLNATSGSIVEMMHQHGGSEKASPAYGQYPLHDGSFLIQPVPSGDGRGEPLRRLRR